ncbi:galactokinase [Alicyclobacillus hesperidum subsp. aegles]|uniref:galactokinase n=1 Tax=Alicyclobacillus hesperidum TaxID=89784 RepID=UPI00222B9A43|nr:galactokinase [Alicyclobacillus hesperidum]GLG01381.1 galactokinase [Alicyclobacillus hesperidum subsp. aegles]
MSIRWSDILEQALTFSPGSQADLRAFFAPGRVNLIGEHTDYNGGYVLPAALGIGTWVLVRPRTDRRFRFASTFSDLVVDVDATHIIYDPAYEYANYPLGVIDILRKEGVEVEGADFFFHGNLPIGAGLSSSASVEVATAAAIDALAGARLSKEKMALLSQRAENEFVGVNCGVMDQFAVAMGQADAALSLNCQTLAYQLVPMHASGYQLVIANTNVPRKLAGSKYNERRAECEAALAILRQEWPQLQALADLSPAQWPQAATLLENAHSTGLDAEILLRRARHVVFESDRAYHAADLLRRGDLKAFGESMNESHRSLRDDYEVTGEALDALVEAAWNAEGCIGSRMTGAGFGGCTVSLVARDSVSTFTTSVAEQYKQRTGREPSFYITDIGEGVHEVSVANLWDNVITS